MLAKILETGLNFFQIYYHLVELWRASIGKLLSLKVRKVRKFTGPLKTKEKRREEWSLKNMTKN